ncbi:MAG: S9 family peptidase [Gemmatimonadales bacterium]|nr:S9 family peptidase [Gemmatimonadales bacterium]
MKPADYGKFESLGPGRPSPDGRWFAYVVTRVDERSELRIANLERDSTRTSPWGSNPRFAASSRWLIWTVGMSPDEREKLTRDKKPIRTGAGLLDLRTGVERTFTSISAAAFDASGRYLALHGYAPDEPKGRGADLRILDLAAGTEVALGNVAEFAWSEVGSFAAVAIATGTDAGNGVQVLDAATGRTIGLDASASVYRQLAWRKKGPDLAVYRSNGPSSKPGVGFTLLAWRGIDRSAPARLQLDPKALGAPDSMQVVEHRKPSWSDDGSRIALGFRPVEPDSASNTPDSARREPAHKPAELPGVQIWHTNDVRIIPMQQAQRQATARRTLLAVWTPDAARLTWVGADLMEEALVVGNTWRHGIERARSPYPWGTKFGRPYHDVWAVDLVSGQRSRVLEKVRHEWLSPDGRYLLWFDGKDYWTHNLTTGARRNLTVGVAAAFADTADDTPTDLPRPHGVGGWSTGDAAVYLYDEFDVWRASPDGGRVERLTEGTRDSVIHRLVRTSPDEQAFDPTKPIYVSLRGEWSEKRGYAVLTRNRPIERLVFEDRFLGGLTRADSAERFFYRREARAESPNYVATGPSLSQAKPISHTNPFLGDYAWTRSELIGFTNETGRPLQGILLYPAGHDPSKRYPMIVYTYEMLSNELHFFQAPSERSYYNYTAWTQNGYFVLMPDIHFRARDPGVAVLETLRPAVAAVAAKGLIDPKRVGLIGHSWGGYTATYVPTRTDLFAASVAGAPLTDFVSFMGQIHWTPGLAEVDHWETGQARMEVPYWEDPEAHHRNSPVHKVHEMKTPLLMAHGNKDGVVEFFQATEFYNFARRAERQMVLLVYEDESHSFLKKANAIDYHRRILEWFGHYLKGEAAPDWITKGISLERLDAEKKRVASPETAGMTIPPENP